MRAQTLALGAVLASLAIGAGNAAAQPSGQASCTATVTAFETTLAPGFVGAEVSVLAAGGRDFGGHVTSLAHVHAGSVEGCFGE